MKTLPINIKTIKIIKLLCDQFDNDYLKVDGWLFTENLHLGNALPIDLIISGRADRVLKFIEAVRDE